ncbi:hypothetical protein COBT_000715 [Conglomerata obtusa]
MYTANLLFSLFIWLSYHQVKGIVSPNPIQGSDQNVDPYQQPLVIIDCDIYDKSAHHVFLFKSVALLNLIEFVESNNDKLSQTSDCNIEIQKQVCNYLKKNKLAGDDKFKAKLNQLGAMLAEIMIAEYKNTNRKEHCDFAKNTCNKDFDLKGDGVIKKLLNVSSDKFVLSLQDDYEDTPHLKGLLTANLKSKKEHLIKIQKYFVEIDKKKKKLIEQGELDDNKEELKEKYESCIKSLFNLAEDCIQNYFTCEDVLYEIICKCHFTKLLEIPKVIDFDFSRFKDDKFYNLVSYYVNEIQKKLSVELTIAKRLEYNYEILKIMYVLEMLNKLKYRADENVSEYIVNNNDSVDFYGSKFIEAINNEIKGGIEDKKRPGNIRKRCENIIKAIIDLENENYIQSLEMIKNDLNEISSQNKPKLTELIKDKTLFSNVKPCSDLKQWNDAENFSLEQLQQNAEILYKSFIELVKKEIAALRKKKQPEEKSKDKERGFVHSFWKKLLNRNLLNDAKNINNDLRKNEEKPIYLDFVLQKILEVEYLPLFVPNADLTRVLYDYKGLENSDKYKNLTTILNELSLKTHNLSTRNHKLIDFGIKCYELCKESKEVSQGKVGEKGQTGEKGQVEAEATPPSEGQGQPGEKGQVGAEVKVAAEDKSSDGKNPDASKTGTTADPNVETKIKSDEDKKNVTPPNPLTGEEEKIEEINNSEKGSEETVTTELDIGFFANLYKNHKPLLIIIGIAVIALGCAVIYYFVFLKE